MTSGARLAGLVGVRRRRAGLVTAVACGLFASGLAGAPGASAITFVHSAKSGELRDGRLVLHGVSGRVTYFSSGRTATAKVKRMHKGVFLPGRPATGVLHVAGHHGGDEPSFRLTRPRYNVARRTVTFKARRLDRKRLPARAARAARTQSPSAAKSRFGASSLTVTSHPTVAVGSGNQCIVHIDNNLTLADDAYGYLAASGWDAWDTDSWERLPPADIVNPPDGISQGDPVAPKGEDYWESVGGDLRGCHNKVTVGYSQNVPNPRPDTFTIETTWAWGDLPTSTCTPANTPYTCRRADASGQIFWSIGY